MLTKVGLPMLNLWRWSITYRRYLSSTKPESSLDSHNKCMKDTMAEDPRPELELCLALTVVGPTKSLAYRTNPIKPAGSDKFQRYSAVGLI
jgi:hypothetical protein